MIRCGVRIGGIGVGPFYDEKLRHSGDLRIDQEMCTPRLDRPPRMERSRVISIRLMKIEGFFTNEPARRRGMALSLASQSSALISPARFLRGVIRKHTGGPVKSRRF
jgi:hypothetical protein